MKRRASLMHSLSARLSQRAFAPLFIAVISSLATVPACSSSTTSPGGGSSGDAGTAALSGDSGGAGGTTCGAQSCQAGEYCLDLACIPGCLADTNCATNQTCVKSGSDNVGACEGAPAHDEASTVDCPTFCAKSQGCDPKGWNTGLSNCAAAKGRTCACTDICGAFSSDCVTCINGAATCDDANTNCSSLCAH